MYKKYFHIFSYANKLSHHELSNCIFGYGLYMYYTVYFFYWSKSFWLFDQLTKYIFDTFFYKMEYTNKDWDILDKMILSWSNEQKRLAQEKKTLENPMTY